MPVAISGNREDLEVFVAWARMWGWRGGEGGGGGDFDPPVHLLHFLLFFWEEGDSRASLEAERGGRVKWRVFRIIDSWPPAPRVTSQVYFPSCVSVNSVCVCVSAYTPEPVMPNKTEALRFNP